MRKSNIILGMTTETGEDAPRSRRGQTKGIGVVNARAWVSDQHGPDAWARLLERRLSASDREVIESAVAVGWIPLDTYARLFRAIDQEVGTGNFSVVREISRYQAERDLNTVYRVLLRFKSPAYVIEKTADLWRRYHDTGSFMALREGTTRATGILKGWAANDVVLCAHNVVAYIQRTLELVGAHDVSVNHRKCVGRGDPWCEYAAEWK